MISKKEHINMMKTLDESKIKEDILPFITMKFLSNKQEETDNIEEFRQKYGFEFRDYELYTSIIKKFDEEDESYISDLKSSINALKNSHINIIKQIYSNIPDDVLDDDSLREIVEILKKDFPIDEFFERAKPHKNSDEYYPLIPGMPDIIEEILKEHKINNFYDPEGTFFPMLKHLDFNKATVFNKNEKFYRTDLQKMVIYDIPFDKVNIENREVIVNDSTEKYDTILAMPPLYDRKVQNKLLKEIDKYGEYKSKNIISVYLLDLIEHLSDGGILITMVTPDILVRKDAEKLRRCLVERNIVDCILDYKLLIPRVELDLLIIRKNKTTDDILFMKEKDGFLAFTNDKVPEIYSKRESIKQFSEVVSKEEIVDNNYNLNPKRYVYLLDYQTRDIEDIMKKQSEYKNSIRRLDEEIEAIVNEINNL